jgi:hypothetical protein
MRKRVPVVLALRGVAGTAFAQYPERPATLVSGFPPGDRPGMGSAVTVKTNCEELRGWQSGS